MTDYYVYSGSAQDDSDANWNSLTLAFLDIVTALVTAAAGDTVWVAHDHSKDYAADATFTNSGTTAAPVKIICVNRITGAITTGAIEQATGVISNLNFIRGHLMFDGVVLKSGDTIAGSGDVSIILKNNTIELLSTAADLIQFNVNDCSIKLFNVDIKFGVASQFIDFGGGNFLEWVGGSVDSVGTAPTTLFSLDTSRGGTLILRGIDLSNIATQILLMGTTLSTGIFNVLLTGCKLPVGVPILNSSSFSVPHTVRAHSCDTGDGYWYFEETYLEGQIVQATNCYLNATYDGTNGFSAKMTSNANAIDQKRPLRFKLCDIYATANPTITVETITAGATLQNDEFWLEIEHPNVTDEALRDIDDSSRQTVGWSGGSGPGTPANLTTSTEAWTEDLISEVKQKIGVTISGGAAGIHTIYACLAKPSVTVYVDPDVTVT